MSIISDLVCARSGSQQGGFGAATGAGRGIRQCWPILGAGTGTGSGGACVAATGADAGAACVPQAVSNTANTSIMLKNSLFFIFLPSF